MGLQGSVTGPYLTDESPDKPKMGLLMQEFSRSHWALWPGRERRPDRPIKRKFLRKLPRT